MIDSTLGNLLGKGWTMHAPARRRSRSLPWLVLAAALTWSAAPSTAHAGDSNLGACCHPNGSCTQEIVFDCSGSGGVYQGDFVDCTPGLCPLPPTTTSTTTTSTTSTTSTTTSPDTTTTTLAEGACCAGIGCFETTASLCQGEFVGSYKGDGSSCTDENICVDCPSGCVDFGETCDDGNTATGDGCDASCQEEACFNCGAIQLDSFIPIGPVCVGPSDCEPEISQACEQCGDGGDPGPGEQCDDGNTANGDCCSAACQFESGGSPCPDNQFCDGAESCDGSGSCLDSQSGADCSGLGGECTIGYCDFKLDQCVADTSKLEGVQCGKSGTCIVANSGVCTDGDCVGVATALDETCRWILIAGSPEGPVRYQNGKGSTMNANACGDIAKSAGITTASLVATADLGEGIRFYGPPEVAGDIVTGGSSVGANLYVKIPGTELKTVAAGTTAVKMPAGIVDATGDHELVQVCVDDKAALVPAAAMLDAKPTTQTEGSATGLKVASGGSATIDVTGDGVAVVEMAGLKVGHGATLTLKGGAGDVIMIRVTGPRLKFGYGSQLLLDGLVAQNVLFYSQGSRCRLSPGVVGSGTVFCPNSGNFKIGVGTAWSGTFLGGTRRVQVRLGAQLTHTPFTGF